MKPATSDSSFDQNLFLLKCLNKLLLLFFLDIIVLWKLGFFTLTIIDYEKKEFNKCLDYYYCFLSLICFMFFSPFFYKNIFNYIQKSQNYDSLEQSQTSCLEHQRCLQKAHSFGINLIYINIFQHLSGAYFTSIGCGQSYKGNTRILLLFYFIFLFV